MSNLIDTIVVNGTEYEMVGLGGEYPVAVFKDEVIETKFDDSFYGSSTNEIYVSNSEVTPTFRFIKVDRNGSISYELAIIVDDPIGYSYTEVSQC